MRIERYAVGTIDRIDGPLLLLRRNIEAGLNEAVTVFGADGRPRIGRIVALDETVMTVEVLESTEGLNLHETRVRFRGVPVDFGVGGEMLGRVFDGLGQPLDGGPPVAVEQRLPVSGRPLNPATRAVPRDFIETGISTIDLLNSLVRGQKLPLFSGGGLPHDRLAIRIAQGARLRADEPFAVVFAGIGIPSHTAEHFQRSMAESGAQERTVMFLNQASDSSTQRLLTPRFALTAAEYLAFEAGWNVLVIMTDMTNYCEALREVSASHGEVPARKAYPGYMYSDLAGLFERAGVLRNKPGSLTQLPILTMPADDITHPIPDLTGYITEGQIVFDRELDRAGLEPPVKVLPSLSRLMKDGIGAGYTDPDHPDLANQLYAAYARVKQIRVLASVVGEDGLPATDQAYLHFGKRFEQEFITHQERRSLDESMAVGWQILADLPRGELTRLSEAQIHAHIGFEETDHGA